MINLCPQQQKTNLASEVASSCNITITLVIILSTRSDQIRYCKAASKGFLDTLGMVLRLRLPYPYGSTISLPARYAIGKRRHTPTPGITTTNRTLPKVYLNRYTERFVSSKSDETNNETSKNPSQSLWQQIQSPPNVITLSRMAATPVLAYWVVSEEFMFAIVGCSLAAASDYLDGYLAKRYGWTTVLGTYLDPLADKAFVNTLGISLWYSGIFPTPLVVVWATKDVMLLSGTGWYLYKKHGSASFLSNSVAKEPLQVTPSLIAKVNTTLQFSTLVVGLMSTVVSLPPFLLESFW